MLLGGSAALGQRPVGANATAWPSVHLTDKVMALPNELSIAGRLAAHAGGAVEVVNAGAIAQDSGGVRAIADELLAWGPHTFFLYLGNNEGIGLAWAMQGVELPAVAPVRGALRHLRLYRLLAERILPLRGQPADPGPAATVSWTDAPGRIAQAQWQSAGRPLLAGRRPTDDVYRAVLRRFEANLRRIVEEARDHGVKVVVVPTPPHLGYAPFHPAGDPGLSAAAERRFGVALEASRAALEAGDATGALEAADAALSLDGANAMAWYRKGLALDRAGRFDEAVEALLAALDLDLSRKRSQPAFNDVAQAVCAELGCRTASAHAALVERARLRGLAAYAEVLGDHEHLTPTGCDWVATLLLSETD